MHFLFKFVTFIKAASIYKEKEVVESMENKASNQTWALTLFAIGVFMAALDNGIISAALTTINDAFDVSANWGHGGLHYIPLD